MYALGRLELHCYMLNTVQLKLAAEIDLSKCPDSKPSFKGQRTIGLSLQEPNRRGRP